MTDAGGGHAVTPDPDRDVASTRATPLGRMRTSVATSVREHSRIEGTCYLLAAALVLSGLVHLGILIVTGGPWDGPLSWRKPASFGLSFGLTLATLTWVLGFVTLRPRTRSVLLAVLASACVVEVLVISVQAWRGLPSHFGVTGPGAGLVAAGAAGGALAIVGVVSRATVAAWRSAPTTAPSMRLALRAGFCSLMVAVALGVYMLARGMLISRGSGDVEGAFAFTATVKPGHAATMHGILVLPALAWLLSFADRSERYRLAVVRAASLGYLLFAGVVVVEVLAGIQPLAITVAPPAATVLALAGTVLLGSAALVALSALRPGSSRSPTAGSSAADGQDPVPAPTRPSIGRNPWDRS